jgi:hypothetical protein
MAQRHLHVAVILDDPAIARAHGVGRPLQKLHVEIGAADQGAGDVMFGVAAPGIDQNAVQDGLVEAERPGGVDQAKKVHGAVLPRVGAIGGSHRSLAPTRCRWGLTRRLSSAIAPKKKAPRPFPGCGASNSGGGALRRGA